MSWRSARAVRAAGRDVYDGAALSKAFTGKAAGEWQYRVRACNGTQCSTPSDTLTVPVPGVTPLSITPSPSTNGSYTVSWQATGSRLQLRERYEDGEWTVVDTYASAVTSKAFTGKQGRHVFLQDLPVQYIHYDPMCYPCGWSGQC